MKTQKGTAVKGFLSTEERGQVATWKLVCLEGFTYVVKPGKQLVKEEGIYVLKTIVVEKKLGFAEDLAIRSSSF